MIEKIYLKSLKLYKKYKINKILEIIRHIHKYSIVIIKNVSNNSQNLIYFIYFYIFHLILDIITMFSPSLISHSSNLLTIDHMLIILNYSDLNLKCFLIFSSLGFITYIA